MSDFSSRRLPARSLADIALSEDAFRADFEITDKYQGFSAELVRLSLLCIAGYGFLLGNLVLKDSAPGPFFEPLQDYKWVLAIGITALGIATAAALAHRFFSTDCLAHQITILRLLNRARQDHWSDDEKAEDAVRLGRERQEQVRDLRRCRWLLWMSAVALILGAAAVVVSFAGVLLQGSGG